MRLWRSLIALAMLAGAATAAHGDVRGLLPKSGQVEGWQWREAPRTYGPKDLFQHIDGAADLFLSYGFREAAVADFVRGDGWITVDIYDMIAPLHAFGIYRSERPGDTKPLACGAEGYQSNGLLAFWKGPHYVKVSVVSGDDGAAATALASSAAARLPGPEEMPAELNRLPRANRIPGTEGYIKTGSLGHKFLVEVVSADYRVGKAVAALRISDLGETKRASGAWHRLQDFYRTDGEALARITGVGELCFAARDSYHGEVVAAQQGRFVVIATSEKANREALQAFVAEALKGLRPDCTPESAGV
jgi:hypothetical protein